MLARKIAVIGAGAWGTALAAHAARLGHQVTLWAREDEVVQSVRARRENAAFLEGVTLPETLGVTGALEEACAGAGIVLFVPPSAFLRRVATATAPHVPSGATVVIATKGIEADSQKLMLDVVAEAIPAAAPERLVVLSGPSFAREVASGLPTDVVVASRDAESAALVQDALHSPMFRVYTSKDPIGVEVGGALKNVLAIAAGVCEGLGLGTNARAALITRGLSEMARLGVALGGDPLTFMGLSGVGDLILTATGPLSRNRALGVKVAEGLDPAAYLASQRTVAEGFLTAKAAFHLATRLQVDMPITERVYRVLHEGQPLMEAMKQLMTRAQKDELWGLA